MSDHDITVVVTAHDETVVAGPTMRSADLAIRAAEADGYRIERLIALDAASDDCRSYFRQPAFADWTVAEFDVRDLGSVRNAVTEIVKGRWLAFLDADDLFSENWLTLGAQRLAQADADDDRVIVHPEINWVFDAHASVWAKTPQDDPLFAPYYFYFGNYYDALCMAPRAAFLEVPYAARDKKNGFAFEDWRWNIDTMAAGWRHVSARDTIIFKRRQDSSLLTDIAQSRSIMWSLEHMAVDRVGTLNKWPGRSSEV